MNDYDAVEQSQPHDAKPKAKRQTVLYVSGLGGSGTTMLGIQMAQMRNAVSLGEVYATLKTPPHSSRSRNRCACGESEHECDFWGELRTRDTAQMSKQAAHALVIERFRELYPGKVLVDTSKSLRELKKGWLSGAFDDRIDLRIIHIVRDYRGWSLTQERKHHNRRKFFARIKPLLLHCLTWWLRNRSRERYFQRSGLPVMTLSYESLVFNRERELQRIAEFAGQPYTSEVDQEWRSRLHDCHGNAVRLNPRVYAELRYDYRWTLDSRFLWISPLLAPVHAYWKSVNYRGLGKPVDTLKAKFATSLES